MKVDIFDTFCHFMSNTWIACDTFKLKMVLHEKCCKIVSSIECIKFQLESITYAHRRATSQAEKNKYIS